MVALAMKAGGFYDSHSKGQANVIRNAHGLITGAMETVPLPAPGMPFTIVDYGCSEGKNSLSAVGYIIDNVRSRRAGQAVVAFHNDIPQNNFNALCSHFLEPDYLAMKSAGPLFSFAAPGSFFEQVMPDDSVHFGISTSAAHWLSGDCTGAVREHVHHLYATVVEQNYFAEIASRDWSAFLRARAAEMRSGGKMVVSFQANNTEANKTTIGNPYVKAFDLISKAVLQLVDENVISREGYYRLAFPIYCRTLAEVRAPFDNELRGVLNLDHVEPALMTIPIREQFECDGNVEDYVCELIPQIRAWSEPVIRHALQLDPKDAAIIEQIYSRMESLVRDDPYDTLSGRVMIWYLVFSKR